MIPVFHGAQKKFVILTLTAKARTPWRAGLDVRPQFSELELPGVSFGSVISGVKTD